VPTSLSCPSAVVWAALVLREPSQFAGEVSSKIMLMESPHIDRARGWHSAGNQRWVRPRHENGKSANAVYLDGRAALRRVDAVAKPADPAAAFHERNFWSREAR